MDGPPNYAFSKFSIADVSECPVDTIFFCLNNHFDHGVDQREGAIKHQQNREEEGRISYVDNDRICQGQFKCPPRSLSIIKCCWAAAAGVEWEDKSKGCMIA